VSFFWTTSIGYICLAAIFVIFIAGFFWMRKLVKIEV
jgi:Flp pilus assembly protein TadB